MQDRTTGCAHSLAHTLSVTLSVSFLLSSLSHMYLLSRRSEDGESMEGPYDWVREYSYQVQQEEAHERRTYIFRFEPGAAVYTHISAKLTLSKRGKLIKGEGASTLDFSRPSAVRAFLCILPSQPQ